VERIWILTVDRERMFAKPFISQLGNGHVQGVYSMCKNPSSLSMMASGSGDGVVKVWSLTSRDETWRTSAQ
jgi:DDB1- and CUL4-associated factor 13